MPTSSLVCSLVLSLSLPTSVPSPIWLAAEVQPFLEEQGFQNEELGQAYIDGHLPMLLSKLESFSPEARLAALDEMKVFIETHTTTEERAHLQALAQKYVSSVKTMDFLITVDALLLALCGVLLVWLKYEGSMVDAHMKRGGDTISAATKKFISAVAFVLLPLATVVALGSVAFHSSETSATVPIDLDEFLEWVEEL